MWRFVFTMVWLLWVYVPDFAQRRPGMVTEPPSQESRPLLGMLTVLTSIPNAKVFLNKKLLDLKKQTIQEKLSPGIYTLRVEASEYESIEKKITIKAGQITVENAELKPLFGFIEIQPSDFEQSHSSVIRIDGKEVAKDLLQREQNGALRIKTSVGHHVLEIALSDRLGPNGKETKLRREYDVVPNQMSMIAMLTPTQTQLTVVTLPGARVYVNAEQYGVVPVDGKLKITTLLPDEDHTVRVEMDGYEPFTSPVKISPREEKQISAELIPLPNSAEFSDTFLDLFRWKNPSTDTIPSTWKVDKGVLEVSGNEVGIPIETRFRDCEIAFGIKLANGRGAAWIVRANDKATNYYLFWLNGPLGKYKNQLRTYFCQDGKVNFEKPLVAAIPIIPPLNKDETYRLRILVQNNMIQHFIIPESTGEEISIGLLQEKPLRFPIGTFGFTTIQEEHFRVYGLVITPKP